VAEQFVAAARALSALAIGKLWLAHEQVALMAGNQLVHRQGG